MKIVKSLNRECHISQQPGTITYLYYNPKTKRHIGTELVIYDIFGKIIKIAKYRIKHRSADHYKKIL
jgi:hypothetical protein